MLFFAFIAVIGYTNSVLADTPKVLGEYGDWIAYYYREKSGPVCYMASTPKKEEGKTDDDLKYGLKWKLDECQREKGMNDMEYTSFIFNVVIGFICGLLGLLHLFVDKKEYVNRTGLIGLCCGIVGFIFSFVYIILNGLVYTTVDIGIIKRDGDGVFAEKTGTSGQFKCLYYDENPHKLHATISDLIKKQYNYDKDMYKNVDEDCIDDPYGSPSFSSQCFSSETIAGPNKCENLYAKPENEIIIKITNFRDKVEEGKKYHKSLKTIQKYWETFFQKMNKEKLKDLKNKIEKFLNTPLEDIKIEANNNKKFLDEFLPEAEEEE